MTVESQVVLVSGGSRGLGRALVEDLLQRGHTVATFSRSESDFIAACKQQDPDGKRFTWDSIDMGDHDRVRAFVTTVVERHDRIDALVNNAAVSIEGVLPTLPAAEIHRGIALNLEAVVFLTQAVSREMLLEERGCIVNISSINAVRGQVGVSVYSATKAALDGMTRSLARELGPYGIRVNSVAPGYFPSEMTREFSEQHAERLARRTPLRRLGTPADIAGVVSFLISPQASFITGQTLAVDGGYTC